MVRMYGQHFAVVRVMPGHEIVMIVPYNSQSLSNLTTCQIKIQDPELSYTIGDWVMVLYKNIKVLRGVGRGGGRGAMPPPP